MKFWKRFIFLFILISFFLLTFYFQILNRKSKSQSNYSTVKNEPVIKRINQTLEKTSLTVRSSSSRLQKNSLLPNNIPLREAFNNAIKSLSLTYIPLDRKKRILILTQSRSGSSFLENLLQFSWPTFGIFEPIRKLRSVMKLTNGQGINDDMQILNQLLKCNVFPYMNLKRGGIKDERRLIDELTEKMKEQSQGNFNEKQIERELISQANQICMSSENIVIKELLMKISDLEHFLLLMNHSQTSSTHAPLHVFYLVRDPRAIISSRNEIVEKNDPGKWELNPKVLCNDMMENLKSLQSIFDRKIKSEAEISLSGDKNSNEKSSLESLISRFDVRLNLIRYEDLASSPIQYSKQLFSSLSLNLTSEVSKWILDHTTADQDVRNQKPQFSTFRNAETRITRWLNRSDSDESRLNVENDCSQVMDLLGYKKLGKIKNSTNNIQLKDVVVIDSDFPFKYLMI